MRASLPVRARQEQLHPPRRHPQAACDASSQATEPVRLADKSFMYHNNGVGPCARQISVDQQEPMTFTRATGGGAGLGFANAKKGRPKLKLIAADNRHPSPAGTRLEGRVIFATLSGTSPVVPKRAGVGAARISEAEARSLQEAAWQTVRALAGNSGPALSGAPGPCDKKAPSPPPRAGKGACFVKGRPAGVAARARARFSSLPHTRQRPR